MAHRMTTLHEESSLRNIPPLQEENEDSYSDTDYDYDSKPSTTNTSYFYAKSRMRSSHTIDSFMDIEKKTSTTSTNLLNYKLLTQNQPFHVQHQQQKQQQQAAKSEEKPALKNGKVESVIAASSSPSMNSSTSSGYGSQAVSISNLTNEDTLSLQSMSVEENTPGIFFSLNGPLLANILIIIRILADFQSSSPPKKDTTTTIYTPSSGQKRFNPFNSSKDTLGKSTVVDDDDAIDSEPQAQASKTNTSPTHTTPLTPASDHPLMDLLMHSKQSKGEFMDDSDEQDDAVVGEAEDTKTDTGSIDVVVVVLDDANQINNNQISNTPEVAESENQQQHQQEHHTVDDEKNNNTMLNESDDDEVDRQRLAPDTRVIRRQKSPLRNSNNNHVNTKNNNRMSYPIGRDRSQPRTEDLMTRSTDRIESGEL
jgi:kinesin family protein 13